MSNKFINKSLKILGTSGQNDDPTNNDLVRVRVACARASIDFENLKLENLKLVEENAKMTKRKDKLHCKLKDSLKENKKLGDLLETVFSCISKNALPKKVYKQISKVLGYLEKGNALN